VAQVMGHKRQDEYRVMRSIPGSCLSRTSRNSNFKPQSLNIERGLGDQRKTVQNLEAQKASMGPIRTGRRMPAGHAGRTHSARP